MGFARRNVIVYQMMVLIMFLIGITFTRTMDLTLPVYILLSALPCLLSIRYFQDGFTILYLGICVCYLLYGVTFQDTRASLVSFCSRLYQFIAFMWFSGNELLPDIRIETRKVLICGIITESMLGVYLYNNSGMIAQNGMVRLVAGAQPVAGNFAIAIIPIMIWSYFHEPKNKKIVLGAGFTFLFWIILSGTRGYLLIFVLSLFLIYIEHWFLGEQNSIQLRNKIIIFLILLLVSAVVLHGSRNVIHTVSDILRLNENTGVRDYENQVALQTFKNEPLPYKLFGMGLGGTAKSIPGYGEAVSSVMTSTWAYNNYMEKVGVSFHNLFANILLEQGIAGCMMLAGVFIWGWRKIAGLKMTCSCEKRCFFLYWVGFFFMNYFRWSCDCGIAEMIILGLVLLKISHSSIPKLQKGEKNHDYNTNTIQNVFFWGRNG